jgi:hypothetical protein
MPDLIKNTKLKNSQKVFCERFWPLLEIDSANAKRVTTLQAGQTV